MRRNILVFGLGVSGKAATQFLLKEGNRVFAVDRKLEQIRSNPDVTSLMTQGLILQDEEMSLEGISQMILSPGIPLHHPLIQKALARNIEVIGEIELAMRNICNPCIGITGSNGKTTTSLLVEYLLKKKGKKARALGNIGIGLSSYLLQPDPEEILVIELSSFQLETLKAKKLDLAVILNVTPNHLDRHPTMEDYLLAKLSIQNCLKKDGKLLVSKQVAEEYETRLQKYEIFDSKISVPISSTQFIRRGGPERQNVHAACSIVKHFGLDCDDCIQNLETFRKPPHRIEWVADIGKVSYYNDSKSSNIHSVMHAVNLFEGPILLIVGGTDKGASYHPWIDVFQGKVKGLIAYGMAADKMEQELANHFPFQKKGLFRDAVLLAMEKAKEGDMVLLSPGCSSYDQFKDYEHRGDAFKQIVKEKEQWIEKKQF